MMADSGSVDSMNRQIGAQSHRSQEDTGDIEGNGLLSDSMETTLLEAEQGQASRTTIEPAKTQSVEGQLPLIGVLPGEPRGRGQAKMRRAAADTALPNARSLAVDLVRHNRRPLRTPTDAEDEDDGDLQASLGMEGMLHPIVVRRVGDHYEIVAGERRFKAALRLGWTVVPVTVLQNLDDERAYLLAVQENLHRKALSDSEIHEIIRFLQGHGDTTRQIGEKLNLHHTTISRRLLVGKSPLLTDAVRGKRIGPADAQELRRAVPEKQAELIEAIVARRGEGHFTTDNVRTLVDQSCIDGAARTNPVTSGDIAPSNPTPDQGADEGPALGESAPNSGTDADVVAACAELDQLMALLQARLPVLVAIRHPRIRASIQAFDATVKKALRGHR